MLKIKTVTGLKNNEIKVEYYVGKYNLHKTALNKYKVFLHMYII